MAKQNLTIFQRLGAILGPDGFKIKQTQQQPKRYTVGKDVLLKTTNKAEYETAKLQAQQNKYIGKVWQKVENGLFQQAINYETTRIGSYSDFEAMEFYPEIAAALDIFMEESTTLNSNGRMVNVYSDSKRVKGIVEDLLFNRLDIHTSLPMWTRNTPIRENSIIPLLDGTEIPIKELSDKVKSGEEIWTYSIQNGTNAIVPSKIIWCDLTRKNSELIRVTLDDGTHLDTTPDHEYMLRDGSYLRADQLTEGISLMPFYSITSVEDKNKIIGYEKIYNPASNKYEYTHRIVAKNCVTNSEYEKCVGGKWLTHHVNFKKKDNTPNNLKRMTNWNSNEFRAKTLKGMTIEINDDCLEYISNIIINSEDYIGINKLAQILKADETFISLFKTHYTLDKEIKKSINPTTLKKVIFRKTNQNFFDFFISIKPSLILDKAYIKAKAIFLGKTKRGILNHKVVSAVKLTETSDVYCLEAVGPNGEHDRHNFPVCSIDVTGSFSRNGVILSNCKYGDNFVFLNIDDKNGVVGVKQMPNYEMERREGDLFDMLSQRTDNDTKSDKVKFYWRGRDVEFNSWQIAHFRLFGDDRRLPYGTSLLEKARRIWKQLLLSEDAMLVYRVTRAPERRIYKIYVGNIDDKDVEAYVNDIANRFKRTPMVDPQTGQMDLRFNQLPVWKNTPIPLLDGRTLTIENLAKEYDEGKENWVYSINDKTHQIVGGKVKWCGKNYTANKMVKVWLDDDTYITTAPEHPFILRDGSHKRADELKENDSLMPFYTKFSKKEDGMKIENYPMVYNPATGKYVFTHRIVGEEYLSTEKLLVKEETNWDVNRNLVLHHKDFIKNNANPTNLQWIGNQDHFDYHSKRGSEILTIYNKSEKKRFRNIELAKEQNWGNRFIEYNHSELHTEHNTIRKEAQLIDWSDPEKKAVRSKAMQVKFDGFIWESIRTNITNNKIKNRKTLIDFLNTDDILNHIISINTNRRLIKQRKIDRTVVERLLIENGFDTITDYITSHKKNHKVKSIEFIDGDDVYCMTVVGPNGEEDRHNFAALSLNKENNICVSGSFLRNSNDQDYFIPVRSEDAPTPIDTLPGAANLDQIADIEYLQKKLFTALRVPKPFLGFDETTGDGKNLALQDIRFSRTINRIQQGMLQELNKIIIIHLFLLGFEDDLDNFTITLNNPSTQAEMLKVEHMQLKITLYKDSVSDSGNGFGAMSMTRAKREILGWSDNDIKQDLLEQRMEKAAAAELANSSNVIKHTGMFDIVDRLYGDMKVALEGGVGPEGAGEESEGGGSTGGLGGGFGGGGTAEGDLDFGPDEEGQEGAETPAGGAVGGEGAPESKPGGEGAPESKPGGESAGSKEPASENIKKVEKLLTEQKAILQKKLDARNKKYKGLFINKLIDSLDNEPKPIDRIKIYDKNVRINEGVNTMIGEIDNMLQG